MIRQPRWFFYFVIGLTLVLDQACKWCAQTYLQPIHSVPVIPGCFELTFVRNPGVAFGMLPGYGTPISIVIMTALIIGIATMRDVDWSRLSPNLIAGLLIGGGLGNLIDRARFGFVVDFIDWHIGSYASWPVFNLADSAICIAFGGMALMMFASPLHPSASPARDS